MATDQWLSEVYGTNGGGDLEKTAQSMLLQKLAEEEGIDLSGLDEDQLDALADAVSEQEGGYEDNAEYEGDEEGGYEGDDGYVGVEDEAQAKFAEADFLGRVMAHSYTQELNKIAEEMAAEEEKKEAPPFPPKKKKTEEEIAAEEAEKTASGPIARAIYALGGSVGNEEQQAAEYVEKLAEARAYEILQANGYTVE